jgi:hypothetical protein
VVESLLVVVIMVVLMIAGVAAGAVSHVGVESTSSLMSSLRLLGAGV